MSQSTLLIFEEHILLWKCKHFEICKDCKVPCCAVSCYLNVLQAFICYECFGLQELAVIRNGQVTVMGRYGMVSYGMVYFIKDSKYNIDIF